MNLKSLYRKVSAAVTFVMRSCTPHHRCHTNNETQRTSNGTQQIVAGGKPFSPYSSVSPQQDDDFAERLSRKLIYAQNVSKSTLSQPHILTTLNQKKLGASRESYKRWRKPTGL